MIASPSDVIEEREIARKVVLGWNIIHSEERRVVLLPVGWETHAAPSMSGPPQDVINQQVLDSSDLLVAIFWTRLGNPTQHAPSGTVEEIARHVDAGKPAMLYFSTTPIGPDKIDQTQYRALQDFKEQCRHKGLFESYESVRDFEAKFTRQLGQTIVREFSASAAALAEVTEEPSPVLSVEATELLLGAAADPGGSIYQFGTSLGKVIQTNQRTFLETSDPREQARWRGALEELESKGLVKAEGSERVLFPLTNEGYRLAERQQSPGEPVNLLRNGSFEDGLEGWGTGWIEDQAVNRNTAIERRFLAFNGATATWYPSPEAHPPGKTSLCVIHDTDYAPNVYSTISQKVTVRRSRNYEVSFWAKVKQMRSRGALSLRIAPSRHDRPEEWDANKIKVESDVDWRRYVHRFNAGDNEQLDVRFIADRPVSAWIDDVVVRELGS